MIVWTLLAGIAQAQIAPECRGLDRPEDYDEQVQQDFLANYPALATTFSPIHGPIPHAPGRAAVGVELAVIPPLSCRRRYVLEWSKTEDTNRMPVAPRIRGSVALPEVAGFVPYVGLGYVPPIPVAGTRSVILSIEAGIGRDFGAVEAGARFHATSFKLVADIATAFAPHHPDLDDFYVASTLGVDLLVGVPLEPLTPYLAVGVTDVSTFFYVADTGTVPNNLHPYFGPVFSLGVDGLLGSFRWGAELYGAPGGHVRPDPTAETLPGFGRYGHLYTARLRVGWEL